MSKVYPDLANAMNEIVRKMSAYLRDNGYAGDPIDMYLAGGMAVNYYCGTRYTEDVDASFSRRVLFAADQIVANYVRPDGKRSFIYLDTNYNPTFALMHEDFETDSLPWNQEGAGEEFINLKILTPTDLAVSKIARFTQRDREDIRALAAEGLITEGALRERAEEALLNYVGNLGSVKNSIQLACDDVKRICEQVVGRSSPGLLADKWNAIPATGSHIGTIKAISDAEVIQSAGQSQHVVWPREKLSGIPVEVGKLFAIGRDGEVREPDAPTKLRGLSL